MERNYITEENRIYLLNENGKVLAEIVFEKVDEKTYDIKHTFVDDSMRWQGIGSELVEKAITYLTAKWYQVSATCTYAKKSVK